MIVDVHAHYYPREYLDLIGRPELPVKGAAPLNELSIEDRLALMDRLGIDIQILSVSQAQPYLSEPAAAAIAARRGNDLYLELCRLHPGRFFTFAALPLPHVTESIDEISRLADENYAVGVTMGCSIGERHVDDPELEPVYAELNRHHAWVLLHPTGTNCLVDGNDYRLNWLVGAPFEDTVAALRLVLSGIADRYPDVHFIVPHLGGTLPFLLARIMRHDGVRGEEALRQMYYDTVSGSVEALQFAADFWGTDRLLYGTDFPYGDLQEFEKRLSYLADAKISERDLTQIRGERAFELLGLAKRLTPR
ncbi:MAG TPA: amidohydrolase family protein [Acidimicrobiales bacterium]|nr:amidohydrolase family protein [Acidimicrobiales bacterium]